MCGARAQRAHLFLKMRTMPTSLVSRGIDTYCTVSPSNIITIMTDTAEAHADPAAGTADTANHTDACAANANDTISDDRGTPRISKQKYGKQLHPLLTEQPIKSLCAARN